MHRLNSVALLIYTLLIYMAERTVAESQNVSASLNQKRENIVFISCMKWIGFLIQHSSPDLKIGSLLIMN